MKPVKSEAFSQKALVPSADLERGDIIIYKPLKSQEWQRAIFYRPIANERNQTVGILCLPLNTVGKNRALDSSDPVREITSKEQILQAGANPSMQRAYVDIHLRTVAAAPQMTGAPRNQQFYKIGTYHGLPFMSALLERVQKQFEDGALSKDGKALKPFDSRYISAPAIARRETKEVRVARAQAHKKLEADAEVAKTAPLREKVQSAAGLSLREAFDKKMIEGRTVLVLLAHSLESGYFPKTLGAAYALVTKQGNDLKKLENPLLEKGDITNAIANIKAVAKGFDL